MFHVDFEYPDLQVICHDQYRSLIPGILEALKPYDLKNHFIIFSSGTTGGDLKGYALSKNALFNNARAVNEHFSLNTSDVWGLSLPVYHVGGLSVLARAYLLKNSIADARHWDPQLWITKIQDVTITTVVPTQLYDLVKLKINAPTKLKYLVVGGDLLSSSLKDEALKLGWPVIRTFGMSEVCSQLASATNPLSDDLEILSIHKTRVDETCRLLVKSESLFTLEFTVGQEIKIIRSSELTDKDGYYLTKDLAQISGPFLKHLGRVGDEVKIAGHLVNLLLLKNQLSDYLVKHRLLNQMEFLIEHDERKGKKLILLSLMQLQDTALKEISHLIAPVKIDELRIVSEFERTALGKLRLS
jgi:o-succinylbenzoate---CoA ligase